MTKQEFIEYLSYPEKLNSHSIPVLEKLVNSYPYFQTAHLLFLKNLHNQKSIDYEKNLHRTSIYAPERKILYNLIKKNKIQENLITTTEVKQPKPYITSTHPTQSTVIGFKHEEITPRLEPIVLLKEDLIGTPQEKKTELLTSAKESSKVQIETNDDLKLLEKEMLRETYRTSVTIELLEKNPPESIVLRNDKQEIDATSDVHSFSEWLNIIAQKPDSAPVEIDVTKQKEKSNLIDQFISNEITKIPPKSKVEFYSAETMAKKSLQDNETIVSETLANIYLKQGNFQKARSAYEILIVKYPEKISIFASLLDKIKAIQEQQKGK